MKSLLFQIVAECDHQKSIMNLSIIFIAQANCPPVELVELEWLDVLLCPDAMHRHRKASINNGAEELHA